MDSSIDLVRKHNQTLAFSKVGDAVSKVYLALSLSSLGGVVLWLVQRLTHQAVSFLSVAAVSPSLAPILIAHLFIYINSSNFYETYFMVWDRRQLDRLLSLILWLLHPFTLVLSLLYPAYWVLWIAFLIFAVFIKNAITRSHEPPTSPARTLLTVWLKRTAFHIFATVVAGIVVWVMSSTWLYRVLGVHRDNPDVMLLIAFQQSMLNWIIVVLVGLGALTHLQPKEDFPVREVKKYQEEMSAYLDRELSQDPK